MNYFVAAGRRWCAGLLALVWALGLLAAPVQAQEVHIAIGEYPPFKVQAEPGGGVLTEVVVEALRAGGLSTRIDWVPNNRAITGTMAGLYDGSFGWAHNAERDEALLFSSKPIFTYRMVFVQRAGEQQAWNQLADLGKQRIGVTRGNFYSQPFADLVAQKVLTVDEANEDGQGLSKLLMRRVDLLPLEASVARYLIATRFEAAERAQLQVQDKEFWSVPIHFVVSRKNPRAAEIMAAFDEGYRELQRSKRLEVLERRLRR